MSMDDQRHKMTFAKLKQVRWADMTWRDYVRIGAGIFFFLLGIAGLVLPILQGVLFLIISAILLAPYSRKIRKLLIRFETKFPWLSEKAHKIAARGFKRKSTDG